MRCHFIVDVSGTPPDASIWADVRLDDDKTAKPAELQEGVQFQDWLLAVLGRTMDGTEDESVDLKKSRTETSRRFTFSYRRNRLSIRPRKALDSNGEEVQGLPAGPIAMPYWEMEVPDDVSFGTCPPEVSSVFIALARMFLAHPLVRAGRSTMRFLKLKGFDDVDSATAGMRKALADAFAGAQAAADSVSEIEAAKKISQPTPTIQKDPAQ